MSHGDFEHGDLTAEIFGLRWRAAVVDFTMQIFVKTLTGRTLTCEVEPTTKVGPALSIPISNLSGAPLASASPRSREAHPPPYLLVKAAAQELDCSILEGRWLASSAVLRNQCHQTSFVPRLKLKRFFLNVFTMVNLHQVGNPEAVVC